MDDLSERITLLCTQSRQKILLMFPLIQIEINESEVFSKWNRKQK